MQDDNGMSFPSYNTLADITGFSRSTIIRAVKELVEQGFIGKASRYRKNEQTSNLYQVYVIDTEPCQRGVSEILPSVSEILPPVSVRTTEPNPLEPNPLNQEISDEIKQSLEIEQVPVKRKSFGNSDVNEVLTYFESRMALNPKSRWARARAKNLVDKYGLTTVKQAIDIASYAQSDPYGPNISNVEKLFYKWNDLVMYARKKEGEGNGLTVVKL